MPASNRATRAGPYAASALVALAACSRSVAVAIPTLPAVGPADTCAPEADDAGETLPDLPANANVVSVSVVGTGPDLDEFELQTKAGAPLDREALRADLHALWQHGVASRVALTATPGPDGYALAFHVTPARRVIRVELDGITRDEVPRLAVLEGTLHDGARLARLAASTQEALRDRGYLRATLDATAHPTCGGVLVLVTGELDRRYRIRTIRATGAAIPVTPAELADDLGHANVPGGAYSRQGLDLALTRILAREQAAGYFGVKGRIDVAPDEPAGLVDVELQITDGPRSRIQVIVDGGTQEMRALAAARVGPLDGTTDFSGLVRALRFLDKEIPKLAGQAAATIEQLPDVYRVRLALAPAARREGAP
jgi:outer membrane protein assembly factor BamA